MTDSSIGGYGKTNTRKIANINPNSKNPFSELEEGIFGSTIGIIFLVAFIYFGYKYYEKQQFKKSHPNGFVPASGDDEDGGDNEQDWNGSYTGGVGTVGLY